MGRKLSLEIERMVIGSLAGNCYVVSNSEGDTVVVDPGGESASIARRVSDRGLEPLAIVATHAHADHISAAGHLAEEWNVPFHLHSADAGILLRANFYRAVLRGDEPVPIPNVDVDLDGKSNLRFGALDVEVVHTPGHTPGGVCFAIEGELFTGDTLMARRAGRTDFPGGDSEVLRASIASIVERYPPETVLHPGHGEPVALGDVVPHLEILSHSGK